MNRGEIAISRAFWICFFSAGAEIRPFQGSPHSENLRNVQAEMHLIYPSVMSKEWGKFTTLIVIESGKRRAVLITYPSRIDVFKGAEE